MSQATLRVLLEELTVARIICQHKQNGRPCGAIIEVPIPHLQKVLTCPTCGNGFQSGDRRYLYDLSLALEHALASQDRAKIEFAVAPPKV